MNIQGKTALITGGGRGIGFFIAKLFSSKGAKVILTGRNEVTLKEAVASIPNASYIVADVTNEKDQRNLVQKAGNIDILVNNAGILLGAQADGGADFIAKAKDEMNTNYFAVLELTELFLPVLKQSGDAAIINIQSILSYLPITMALTYSASKAALHSYSQGLRIVLEQKGAGVKVFEVFPPYIDTDMTKGVEVSKMKPEDLATDILEGVENDLYAIRSGLTKDVYANWHKAPEATVAAINGL
ncbi:SDR family NAD(P)-dependent oxidoreductase [Chitinophaga sp. SYP-B3965]|uniref:SDR family NAD(P)-dependent oxidoreductase n=1 Tax=Chitinophaga sp. SYP-B3965 TaxID=2663120 RepID=UPI001299E443|nr:SDR family NAD(P)-dependent oxidoreductase [Chitinophaga sp. SYP-B3965]MRG44626.1 SDR family NAD(P)-dependent oxidoreductase [Chitinophaga sp. SYP-B3965]